MTATPLIAGLESDESLTERAESKAGMSNKSNQVRTHGSSSSYNTVAAHFYRIRSDKAATQSRLILLVPRVDSADPRR
jgi:hypothetical protein